MCQTSIYEARNNFSALIKLAENGECVELLRHNKPVAVLISYEEFSRSKSPENTFLTKLNSFRNKWELGSRGQGTDSLDDAVEFINNNRNTSMPNVDVLTGLWD